MPPVAPAVPESRSQRELSERLEQVKSNLGGYAQLSRMTGLGSESIRRWCQTGRPTVEFIAALRTRANISPHWLLYNEGPMDVRDHMAWVLRQATHCELLLAVGERISLLEKTIAELAQSARTKSSAANSAAETIPLRTATYATNELKHDHSPHRPQAGAG